jgi:hypothetical protein
MRKPHLSVLAVAALGAALSAQAASASVSSSQLSKFKTIDAVFAKADGTWTSALSNMSQSATAAQLSKPSLVFVPSIKTFDTALTKIGFTGSAGAAVKTVVALNSQLITDLSNIKSASTFESQFAALNPKYGAAQSALAKALGLQPAYVTIY